MRPLNFVLVGVGGQGILLASDLLCHAGMAVGYDVKKTDVHGMAQRGGSVISHVRLAEQVFSPMVPIGTADFLLAFEKLEACRWASYLKCDGIAVVNDEVIPTLPLGVGSALYPSDDAIASILQAHAGQVSMIPAGPLAAEMGNTRAANVVLLGSLSRFLDIPVAVWQHAIAERVPARFQELNQCAFEVGRQVTPR
ncbi:MAG: indolepyruvate oxidoreductase subunit beta [Anaerolineae bacterium]